MISPDRLLTADLIKNQLLTVVSRYSTPQSMVRILFVLINSVFCNALSPP